MKTKTKLKICVYVKFISAISFYAALSYLNVFLGVTFLVFNIANYMYSYYDAKLNTEIASAAYTELLDVIQSKINKSKQVEVETKVTH